MTQNEDTMTAVLNAATAAYLTACEVYNTACCMETEYNKAAVAAFAVVTSTKVQRDIVLAQVKEANHQNEIFRRTDGE